MDVWIQLCVDVQVAVYVFVGASENEGLEVGVSEGLRVDVNERVRVDVIERDTALMVVQVAVGATENLWLDF